MMASSWWLLTLVLFYYIQIKSAVAQYRWNCSVPDDRGERYIPGTQRVFDSIIVTATAEDSLWMYRVQNLNADCTREPVTAIEFCYRYNTDGPGEAVFNWTVLILEETNVFTITRIIAIESHPKELDDNDCMDVGGGQVACCDREYINSFNFQTNNFIFGVTESAQGNTHGATLLGFHESLLDYTVQTSIISTTGQNISVGSTLPRPGGSQRGLRLLWFVTGSTLIGTTDAQTTSSLIDPNTADIATGKSTSQDISTDAQTTRILIDHHSTTGIDSQATAVSTSQDILATQEEREADSTAAAMAPILTLVGAVVGAVILLSAIAIVILLMACLVRKNTLKRDLNSGNGREMKISMVEKINTVDIEVDTNPSYIPLCTQISTENNVAYGEVMMNQDGNDLYEITDPPIEDSTTQLAQDGRSGEYTDEYDYIC